MCSYKTFRHQDEEAVKIFKIFLIMYLVLWFASPLCDM